MFLRSLTLKGFKSFAEKTTLEFAPGISVIVGPNGSGKSNLVDAISWVLGEQGPRALRGGQMSDVIFAGSPKRAALGMAEVKLVIDNEAGKIPVPMTELEIGRAVFRAGDAEYRISGQQCRLLDIQELLSDSGIGRALHTVVGQGQLDDVLTARPEERRQFIEEAAGIAKHRRRKERAQRKLGALEHDVLRLQDVLLELKRQLRPLKQQAESAQRHEKLSAEAEEASWRLAAARLRLLIEARDSKRPTWEQGMALRTGGKKRLEELDAAIEELATARELAARELVEAEAGLRTAQADLGAADAALREAAERETAAKSRLQSEASRSVRLDSLKADMARSEAALRDTAVELEQRERELETAEAEFRQAEEIRREAEEERRRLSEEAAAHRAEMETLRRSLATHDRERARLEESLDAAGAAVDAAGAERASFESELLRLGDVVTPITERQAILEGERHTLASRVAEIEDALRRAMSKRDVLEARRADADETPGSRYLKSNPGRTIGLLRDLVDPADDIAAAVSAALGPYADAVVYERTESALEDVGAADGATLAVGDASGSAPSLASERALIAEVGCDPRARGLLEAILTEVYLVEDLAKAASMHRRHSNARFVTPQGVMIGRGVIQTAAGADTRARAIQDELFNVEREIAKSNQELKPAREAFEAANTGSDELAARIKEIETNVLDATVRLNGIDSRLASGQKEVEMLTQRLVGMDDAADSWRVALASAPPLTTELPPLPLRPEAPISARVAVETLRRDRVSHEAGLERLRAEHDGLAAETPQALRAAADAAEAERQTAEAARTTAAEIHETASARREAAAQAEREATNAETTANREWREAAAELERLRETYEEEDRARGEIERRIAEGERTLKEGYSRDPQEALAALSEADTVADLERRSEVVARRLALLGKVNLLATGEFEAVQERHDFLMRELDDVKKARRDLLEVIRRVDDEVVALFDAAFRDVAREFESMFKELFPGGEGRLVLTDPANLLETGIDVEARPGRKRVKRLSLLSGGERALTALGFLFSIFKARPSPFYLLDEVEAALDDVNLHRFLGLIKGFAQDSQVIIVTHQKRTMEVADMLYGVSMSPDVSSRVVCQRLDHGDAMKVEPLAVSKADSVV